MSVRNDSRHGERQQRENDRDEFGRRSFDDNMHHNDGGRHWRGGGEWRRGEFAGGVVRALESYGALVALESERKTRTTGLIPNSELPKEGVKAGQRVKVVVLESHPDRHNGRERLRLSLVGVDQQTGTWMRGYSMPPPRPANDGTGRGERLFNGHQQQHRPNNGYPDNHRFHTKQQYLAHRAMTRMQMRQRDDGNTTWMTMARTKDHTGIWAPSPTPPRKSSAPSALTTNTKRTQPVQSDVGTDSSSASESDSSSSSSDPSRRRTRKRRRNTTTRHYRKPRSSARRRRSASSQESVTEEESEASHPRRNKTNRRSQRRRPNRQSHTDSSSGSTSSSTNDNSDSYSSRSSSSRSSHSETIVKDGRKSHNEDDNVSQRSHGNDTKKVKLDNVSTTKEQSQLAHNDSTANTELVPDKTAMGGGISLLIEDEQDMREAKDFKRAVQQKRHDSDGDGEDDYGPMPLIQLEDTAASSNKASQQKPYGGALLPGEGEALAQYVQQNLRIPRRGEIGYSGDDIQHYENSGYVMSGSRHARMNAVRIRKENQVYSAEEQRALALITLEENQQKESALLQDFRTMLQEKRKLLLDRDNTTNNNNMEDAKKEEKTS